MNDDEKWLSPRKIVDYYVDYLIPKGGFRVSTLSGGNRWAYPSSCVKAGFSRMHLDADAHSQYFSQGPYCWRKYSPPQSLKNETPAIWVGASPFRQERGYPLQNSRAIYMCTPIRGRPS